MLDRDVFFHAQAIHQRLHALAREDAHQVIFERRKKREEPGSP